MLVKHYRNWLLPLMLALAVFLGLIAFYLWYTNYTVPLAPHWAQVLGAVTLPALLIYLPVSKLRIPDLFLPLFLILGINSIETTLRSISHSLTFANLSWPLLVYTLLSVSLVLRRHMVYGWLFFTSFVLLTLNWHANYFNARLTLASEFFIPTALMLVATLVPKQIEQAVSKTRQARGMRVLADSGRAEEQDMSQVATQRVQEVRTLTEDMLHRIAYNPSPVTPQEMDEFRFTEAQLRDTIRGRYIVNQQILDAAWLARQRGVKVDILDERGSALPPEVTKALTQAAVDLFDNALGGTITIRAFPADDRSAVLLVHDGNSEEEEPSAIDISQTGQVERF